MYMSTILQHRGLVNPFVNKNKNVTYQSHVYGPRRISGRTQIGRLEKRILLLVMETHELYDQVP